MNRRNELNDVDFSNEILCNKVFFLSSSLLESVNELNMTRSDHFTLLQNHYL